jgi:putative transposase
MPRLPRRLQQGDCYHVINRGNVRARLFYTSKDYQAFVDLLGETVERFRLPLLAYCVMPNHWHLVVASLDHHDLSRSLHWLTGTHAGRWSRAHERPGPGHVYQGRFKSIPVQPDVSNLYRVLRYVDRNAWAANLVDRAQDWPWCSVHQRLRNGERPMLEPLQLLPLEEWVSYLHEATDDEGISKAVRHGQPIGSADWVKARRSRLGLPELRSRGRPRLQK